MLVTQSALQCETAPRPLVLDVDRVEARAVALPERRVTHRELNRRPVVEDVADLAAGILEVLLHLERGLIPDLQAVRTGDVQFPGLARRCGPARSSRPMTSRDT